MGRLVGDVARWLGWPLWAVLLGAAMVFAVAVLLVVWVETRGRVRR